MKRWGRILRGSKPDDFVSLSDNPDRKIVFFIPDSELKKLMRVSDYEKLKLVGWTDSEIKNYISKGKMFKLIIFPANKDIGKPATWKNLSALITKVYPNQPITKSFLTDTLNINSQFTGIGYTKNENGLCGIREIVGLNRKVCDIQNSKIIDLNVEFPH